MSKLSGLIVLWILSIAGSTAALAEVISGDTEAIAMAMRDRAMRGQSGAWERLSELTTRFGDE